MLFFKLIFELKSSNEWFILVEESNFSYLICQRELTKIHEASYIIANVY